MKVIYSIFFIAFATGLFLLSGCDKNKEYDIITPPSQGHFINATGTYYVTNDPNSTFKIPIGVTTASGQSRTINLTVTSPTGAKSGTQYSLAATSVTIPAGKAVDTITVKGIFSGYSSSRVDTLVLTISGGDVSPSSSVTSSSVYKLVMRKSCDVVGANLVGSYTHSTDTYSGGPSTEPNYTAVISNFTPLTSTTATVIIKNLGATSDVGWGAFSATDAALTPGLTATLNYADPAQLTVTIPSQNYFGSGSSISTITGSGTFSACDNTFSITCTVKYAPNGNSYVHTSLLNK